MVIIKRTVQGCMRTVRGCMLIKVAEKTEM